MSASQKCCVAAKVVIYWMSWQKKLRYGVELVLTENFAPSLKTLRECLDALVSDFVLESLFCAQILWILNLVFSAVT